MLKLSKSVSAENYPLSPLTSSVRKLTLTVQPSNPVDLGKSYLIVKNTLSTTVRGEDVVRNVGWGTQLTEDKVVMYPNTVQLRTAALYLDGQMVEYCEDLNIRIANMDAYTRGVEEIRKYANVGKYGFQRVEGARIGALNGQSTPFMDGCYLSPFLERPILADGSMDAARYKEVAGVIHLSDIFGFCASAGQVNLAGRTVKVELQFEDRFEILCEVVNYPANCSDVFPTPRDYMTLATAPATVQNDDGTPIDLAALTGHYRIQTTQTFRTVSDVPFYVGQPICLWQNNAQPAVVGSNYAIIEKLALNADAGYGEVGSCVIYFKQYDVAAEIVSAGHQIDEDDFAANFYVGTAGVCVGISGVYDPKQTDGNDQLQFNDELNPPSLLGAGLTTTYQITGIEAVMCELVGMEVASKEVEYVAYSRDMDTISANQLYYQKSFILDPGCVALFAVAPCAKLHGLANRNIWAVSEQEAVSSGVSFRNMMNGQQLYSHDIVFSNQTQNVEPLHFDRLEMALEAIEATWKNSSTVAQMVVSNGTGQHVLIAEAVPMSEQPQQFQVRLSHALNGDARTIYVFKAIVKAVKV